MLGLADDVPLLPQNTGLQLGLEGDSLAMVKLWGCSYDPMVICAEHRKGPGQQALEGTIGVGFW